MTPALLLAEPGLLDLSLSFVAEAIVFVLMIAVLARYAYPWIIGAAESRQRRVAEQLTSAEKARTDAEARLVEAREQLEKARAQASDIIEGAGRSGEQLRVEMREKAEEEVKRVTEDARREIEAERRKAVDSVRSEVADLVVAATTKIVGETMDDARHRRLIDEAIKEVGAAQ